MIMEEVECGRKIEHGVRCVFPREILRAATTKGRKSIIGEGTVEGRKAKG